VPNLGDFTTPDFWEHAERADLHAGGVPCQPFSAAGRQLGEADDRHLWPFWLDGIRRTRPATIVFENVAGLTQGKKRATFDQIVADLVSLGYDVRWCLLGACAIGACHHRHRVFLLACRTRTTAHARQVTVATCGKGVAAYLPTPQRRDGDGGDKPSQLGGTRESGAKRTVSLSAATSFLPSPMARDGDGRGEGDDTYWTARAADRSNGVPLGAAIRLLPSPRSRDGLGGPGHGVNMQGGIGLPAALNLLPESGMTIDDRFGKYAAAVARHARVMGTLPPEPTEIGPKGGRRLAAAFSEWMMMLPAGHVTDVLDRGPALERCGNGVVPLQAATALGLLFDDLVH
jgi:DNA (cytosine-5)-methyltransferase 1